MMRKNVQIHDESAFFFCVFAYEKASAVKIFSSFHEKGVVQ